MSIVWVGVDGDEIVSAHSTRPQASQHRARPARRGPIEAEGRNEIGLDHYLVVHGTARLVAGGGPELLQQLAEVYLGPGVKFPPFDNPPVRARDPHLRRALGGIGPWTAS